MNDQLILAEDQHKLNDLKIGIYENSFESEILIANLVGLGIREIACIGEKKGRLLGDEFLQGNNPVLDLYFEEFGETYDFKIGGNNADFRINQKGILGGIETSIIADEIRKKYARIGNCDYALETEIQYDVKDIQRKKVLAIGAGGIGNYFCLGAEKVGHETRLVDYDIFDSTNANRQIFCRVGKPKVEVIEEQLNYVEGINRKFDAQLIEDFDKEGYLPEVVIGCVDNTEARNLIRSYALEREIPYFDGGVERTFGSIYLNPEEREVREIVQDKKKTSCLYKPHPSVVIPNSIIGLKLAECAGQDFTKYQFHFDSKMKMRMREEAE